MEFVKDYPKKSVNIVFHDKDHCPKIILLGRTLIIDFWLHIQELEFYLNMLQILCGGLGCAK
jgi:hypothetical protein